MKTSYNRKLKYTKSPSDEQLLQRSFKKTKTKDQGV
jgi:hypothetical protein